MKYIILNKIIMQKYKYKYVCLGLCKLRGPMQHRSKYVIIYIRHMYFHTKIKNKIEWEMPYI